MIRDSLLRLQTICITHYLSITKRTVPVFVRLIRVKTWLTRCKSFLWSYQSINDEMDRTMTKCTKIEYKGSFDGCTATPKHMNTITKYSNSDCDEHKGTSSNCGEEATAAKGLNGEPIQLGSTSRPGPCPKCLS